MMNFRPNTSQPCRYMKEFYDRYDTILTNISACTADNVMLDPRIAS